MHVTFVRNMIHTNKATWTPFLGPGNKACKRLKRSGAWEIESLAKEGMPLDPSKDP